MVVNMEISVTAIVTVIIGISQILKGFGLSSKWIPAANIALGLLGAFLYAAVKEQFWAETVFMGIVVGLTASGLYSGVKNISEGIKGK